MPERPIYYRERPGEKWELWGHRQAKSLKEIEESARNLLTELREEGLHRAAVRMGNMRVWMDQKKQ